MSKYLPWLVALAAVSLAAPLSGQNPPAIAVLPFENAGSFGKDKEDFEALRRGLAATLASELGASGAVRSIDRDRVQKAVDERGTSGSERIDLATAARIGKALDARYTVAGTFIDLYGDFRIDAQIIDVESGEVVKVVRSDPRFPDRAQMFRIVQSVADRILEAIKLPGSKAPRARNIPTEALSSYSRALLYQDRGDRTKAVDFASRAVKAYPDFAEAQALLKRLQGG